jgi:hypothetical protein
VWVLNLTHRCRCKFSTTQFFHGSDFFVHPAIPTRNLIRSDLQPARLRGPSAVDRARWRPSTPSDAHRLPSSGHIEQIQTRPPLLFPILLPNSGSSKRGWRAASSCVGGGLIIALVVAFLVVILCYSPRQSQPQPPVQVMAGRGWHSGPARRCSGGRGSRPSSPGSGTS